MRKDRSVRKNILVIGTGFLGRLVVDKSQSSNNDVIFTHNTRPYFDKSIQFNFLKDDVADIVDLTTIDCIVLTMGAESKATSSELSASVSKFLEKTKNSRLVYISSDAVFDGKKGLYLEQDTPIPATQYGKNKRLFENLIESKSKNYCIIRPSYIYGFSLKELDRRLQKTIDIIKYGGVLEVFDDMYKSPIDVNQLSEMIIQQIGSVFVGIIHAGGERINVHEFKKRALDTLGLPTFGLIKTSIPLNHSPNMLKDTSLDNSLMKEITGIVPYTIEYSLMVSKPKEWEHFNMINLSD